MILFVSAFALVSPACANEAAYFAITRFWVAGVYYAHNEDCPTGKNLHEGEIAKRALIETGHDPNEFLDRDGASYSQEKDAQLMQIITFRGRIDGKPANAYAFPESVSDPHIKTGSGKYGYGFNLDGKTKSSDFIDPETGERGVDNNLYRVYACNSHTRQLPPPQQSVAADFGSEAYLSSYPPYILEISSLDEKRDDYDVTVTISMSLDTVVRDASGEAAQEQTLRVDPDPRWQNVVHGKMKNGVLTTDVFDLNLPGNPEWFPEYHFKQARLRLRVLPEGKATGILGGYHDWLPFYRQMAIRGTQWELIGDDVPGTYYALKRLADGYPDPGSGEMTAISSAFAVKAVRVLIQKPKDTSSREEAQDELVH